MHIRNVKLSLVFLLVVCVASALPAWAQSTSSGTVVGQVTDQTGAVVPGAAITITDVSTSSARAATTNANGRFTYVDVDPGTYTVTASKAGFAISKSERVEVKVGITLTVNLALQVGGANVVVEVQSTGTELQTMNSTVGNTVTANQLDSLPSLNRDVSTFVELQPGVSPDGSVAGAVVDQSSFMLDGGNNTNDMDGSMSVYTTSFAGDPTGGVANQSNAVAAGPTGVVPTPGDSVEEFKVNTANQTADFNSSSGAEVQVVTRRGTNVFHGSVYEYYLDNNFNANTWQNNLTGTPEPDFHRSRFGFRVGGPMLPKLAGGKTYFFFNLEGYRWPQSETVERAVPSADMRLGLLSTLDSNGNILTTYNLNDAQVTSAEGVLYPANANCTPANGFASGVCDPRGLGVNSLLHNSGGTGLWDKNMPLSNEATCSLGRCDGVNVLGFKANLAIPQSSNFFVTRVDHDFGDKWHFTTSYRYFKLKISTDDQVDIGGGVSGDKLGVPTSLSKAPQEPSYFVAGLTTDVSSTTTNNIHYSFLKNWWAWARAGDPPQISGLAGALEPFGETKTQQLGPYNVNTQQSRTRFWDGHDQMFRDDVSMLRGNHLFQLGGTYQHNWNYHERTDNGGGINYEAVYQLGTTSGAGNGVDVSGYIPSDASSATTWGRDYTATLGIVSIAQQAYTRSGPTLALNPPLTPAQDKSTIPFYNVYFSDTWHMKKTFTLTYGLGWTLEMPPVEQQGRQIELVDQANQLIDIQAYLHSREQAALQGQVYNPIVGFTLVGNSENGRKYPYDPFYGSFSPRIAAAWNPKFDNDSLAGKVFGHDNTVVRGGYGRIYGRLNGVDLVLVPLLGTGLIQPVQCIGPIVGDPSCLTPGSDPTNAFRIGVDGMTAPLPAASPTLPQPLYPGINGIAAGAGESLDPHFRPNVVDSFDLTIQRQLHRNVTMELGYIGRRITHEYQPINMNAVPYMMTLGGQRFDKAYANVVMQYCGGIAGLAGGNCAATASAVTPQAFFETALAGTGYCTGYSSCTAALVANEGAAGTANLTYANVWSLWSDLDGGDATCPTPYKPPCGFNFARTMMNSPIPGSPDGGSGNLTSGVAVNASVGHGNYEAGFFSLKIADWHGLTAQSNFTWSKILSTGSVTQSTSEDTAVDPYDLNRGYGLAGFDRKFVYNMALVYQPSFYRGQQGPIGHILGGWTISPIFATGTGLPVTVGTINGGGQAFGEGDSVNFYANGNSENAVPIAPLPKTGVFRSSTPGQLPNFFANGTAAINSFRQPILGLDNRDGGWGVIRGLAYWNVDLAIRKNFKITERFNFEFNAIFTNVFNHVNFNDPAAVGGDYLDTSSPSSFGVLPGQANSFSPRNMEFGLRLNF